MPGWWPEEKWAGMLAGEDCPMCADAHVPTNRGGELVAELDWSFARLAVNQTHAGYCVVVFKQHVAEIDDRTKQQRDGFWADVAIVATAIRAVFAPRKLDYLVMGHRIPHLHCHVYPQYSGDDPLHNVDIWEGDVRLDAREMAARVGLLRDAIVRVEPST